MVARHSDGKIVARYGLVKELWEDPEFLKNAEDRDKDTLKAKSTRICKGGGNPVTYETRDGFIYLDISEDGCWYE